VALADPKVHWTLLLSAIPKGVNLLNAVSAMLQDVHDFDSIFEL